MGTKSTAEESSSAPGHYLFRLRRDTPSSGCHCLKKSGNFLERKWLRPSDALPADTVLGSHRVDMEICPG